MAKVNVLCAPPNGRNPGMASVDLAFETVARDLGCEPTYWRLWDQTEWLEPPGGSRRAEADQFFDETSRMTYKLARGHLEEFLDADAVVFWGDFHHMAVYLDQTADVLHRRMNVSDRREAEDIVTGTLMLRGQPDDVLARTVTFGTTLAFNSARDYSGSYGRDFRNFVGRAHGAWFRDGYSARVAELVRHPRAESCLGSDAAFLTEGPQQSADASGLGVFIGRSNVSPEKVAGLGKRLTSHPDGLVRWIPWGTAPAMWPMWGRKRLRVAWPELEVGRTLNVRDRITHLRSVARGPSLKDEVLPASELFERIASCELILTDTYHLAVNAWRIGTPAILLSDRKPTSGWNVNSGAGIGRDKRHDLYSQLDALPLLLDTDSLPTRDSLGEVLDELERLRPSVKERAARIERRARGLVTNTLKHLVAGD